MTELQQLSKHCDFGSTLKRRIRDQLVVGINDERIQWRLLSKLGSLDLARVIELTKGLEAAERGATKLRKSSRLTSEPCVLQLTSITTAAGTGNQRPRRPPGETPNSAS